MLFHLNFSISPLNFFSWTILLKFWDFLDKRVKHFWLFMMTSFASFHLSVSGSVTFVYSFRVLSETALITCIRLTASRDIGVSLITSETHRLIYLRIPILNCNLAVGIWTWSSKHIKQSTIFVISLWSSWWFMGSRERTNTCLLLNSILFLSFRLTLFRTINFDIYQFRRRIQRIFFFISILSLMLSSISIYLSAIV